MESTPQSTPEISTPTPATVEIQSTPAPAAVQSSESGGAMDSFLKHKMNVKDIVISALLVTMSAYGIWYYRSQLKALKENPTAEEHDDLRADVDELMLNVKKALGNKYQTT